MTSFVDRMDRHQILLYLVALAVGAAVGLAWPAAAGSSAAAVNPVLALLILATFLGVPFHHLGAAVRDLRFMLTLLVVNFVLAPLVVWACTRMVSGEPGLLLGALFVLLCPCVDYVMVFTGLAGGDRERLLAASPLLMLFQALLLPLWLRLMAGPDAAAAIRPGPFLQAFVWLILLPFLVALVAQWAATRSGVVRSAGAAVSTLGSNLMVVLMMVTLACVVASQIHSVSAHLFSLLRLIPVYVLFAVVMFVVGRVAATVGRQSVVASRAIVFSGVTRNSLVVLPLVLSLANASGEGGVALAPLAVVTQTLVELLIMVAMVRVVPRLVR